MPPPPMDANFARMKKSCERIAAVLGIREGSGNTRPSGVSFGHRTSAPDCVVPDSIHKSPLRTNPATDYAPEPMNFTNMNNPTGNRH